MKFFKEFRKLLLCSFVFSLWLLYFIGDSGLLGTMIFILPLTALIAPFVAFTMDHIIAPFVQWFQE
jgi:hypothetical protein